MMLKVELLDSMEQQIQGEDIREIEMVEEGEIEQPMDASHTAIVGIIIQITAGRIGIPL